MENLIQVRFDKATTNLAGNRYGNQVFESQIQKKLDYTKLNIVVFPEAIEDIASSFIEGIYKFIGEKYGKTKALEIMCLQAENFDAQEKIKESIETFGV